MNPLLTHLGIQRRTRRWRSLLATCRTCDLRLGTILILAIASTASAQTRMQPVGQPPQRDYYAPDNQYDDYDTLTRGPVHEAFAEPIAFDPEPGRLAPVAPPEPIYEVPPDYRPEGYNVQWIPGYWIWDDEINDYLWVSGIWREVPPGREWIAGYWIQAQHGYRWIPGFWADTNRSQQIYLPEPPASIETGPNIQTASPNDVWISGTWIWNNNRYAWRPGYWTQGRPDWIWVPAHYVWSPRGYVFVDGYWDYDVDRRGLLFAPVRFQKSVYRRPNFRYSPRIVVDLRTLTDHLFLRSNDYHYYFGDYFDARYANRGYRPWFSTYTSKRVYDPIYQHRRWQHRNDRDWDNRLRRDFDHRRQNVHARPARSWADQRRYTRDRNRNADKDRSPVDRLRHSIGKTLTQIVNRKHDSLKFTQLDENRRRELSERRKGIDQVRSQRRAAESRNDGKPDRRYRTRTVPAHEPVIKSPVSSKPHRELGEKARPPARPNSPGVKNDVPRRRRTTRDDNSKSIRRKDDKRDDRKSRDDDDKDKKRKKRRD